MKTIAILIVFVLTVSCIAIPFEISNSEDKTNSVSTLTEIPEYVYDDGYGYDNDTGIMEDNNGFQYSYQPDGIVRLVLPWGYTTHFSFGLTGDHLGTSQIRTALDYEWNWEIITEECLNETGELTGHSHSFIATNVNGKLDWSIAFEFKPNTQMKITHTLTNGYANTLENVEFWYLWDLRGTESPYTIETHNGIIEGPLYMETPDNIHWVRLGNQFQFDWHDALDTFSNGHAYIGDGNVLGLPGLPILGISIRIGSILSGESISVDPYFSGITRTWNALADSSASVDTSWSPVGIPATGDNITYDGTSVFNCNWNVEVTLGDFSMLTGYTGTVIQGTNFGLVDFSMAGGTFTADKSYTLTCSGDFTHTGGVVSTLVINLLFDSAGTSTWTTATNFRSNSLTANGNLVIAGNTQEIYGQPGLAVAVGKTLTLNAGLNLVGTSCGIPVTNLGTIAGASGLTLSLKTADTTWSPGIINCPVTMETRYSAIGNRALTLASNGAFGSTFAISSAHASYTFTLLHGSNHTLGVTGAFTLGNRAIMTQGTGAWSFGSYTQTGINSVFDQGAALTIGGDLTVSDGVFNAIGDMIVPGDWDTATGDYVNDDNVVTLTGASKTLAMHADDSFYNVTVSGSYTMDTDTTVRLRATISGTVDGAGDFIEPLPEFTSTPELNLNIGEIWEYTIEQTYWDTVGHGSLPGWLIYETSTETFRAMPNATGSFLISVELTWNDMTTYQNFTIVVASEVPIWESEFAVYLIAMLILLTINILGAVLTQIRILTFVGLIGIAILCVPTALAFISYGPLALVLILANVMIPVMSTMNNIKGG